MFNLNEQKYKILFKMERQILRKVEEEQKNRIVEREYGIPGEVAVGEKR